MKVVGINWEQNSTVSLWIEGKLIGTLSEERLSRVKNDERYPIQAINFLLKKNNLKRKDIDKVVFVSTMWSPGYILTRHYTKFTIQDYIREQREVWKPRLYEKAEISQLEVFRDKLDVEQFPGKKFWNEIINEMHGDSGHVSSKQVLRFANIRKDVVSHHLGISVDDIVFMDHSRSHANYAYFMAPKIYHADDCIVCTLDAFGDNLNYTAYVYKREEGKLKIEKICSGDSFIIGRLYRYVTLILGLKPNEHEYKVMGMAPYCKEEYSEHIVNKFKDLQDVEKFNFVFKNKPKDLYFAIKEMLDGERFDSISGAIQRYTEYLVGKWISNLTENLKINNLVMAGGVCMNVKNNMLIAKKTSVKNLFVPPSPDDSSQSMGCVLSYLFKEKKHIDSMTTFTPYLGQNAVTQEDKTLSSQLIWNKDREITIRKIRYNQDDVASMLCNGLIVARCSGREEFGARALGNRSILADPRSNKIKKIINEKIKNRDFWMPFACSVIEEYAEEYFNLDTDINSYRYMTMCCETTKAGKKLLEAAIHPYDETCRPQIVDRKTNVQYYDLIEAFGLRTGCYGLLNTSFNLHGEPIVSNSKDAYDVFLKTEIDVLIIEDEVLVKTFEDEG
ncbi:carbamoyltransferase C-terminal domain-containing protein [Synechococcus sp. CC9616]|uniref:carbamoyltransferase C-terminal domain-containing protein n=1 Tax=Synechococcus sp. CC9616 TaxID=110663 RepID=UPI00048EBD9E|nr:carbamoyltransferase C-terminal domain-containing protein [Synechococcus sp. CC9616]